MCTQRRLSWGVIFSLSKKEIIAPQMSAHRHTISKLGYHNFRSKPTVPSLRCTESQGGLRILVCHFYWKDPASLKEETFFFFICFLEQIDWLQTGPKTRADTQTTLICHQQGPAAASYCPSQEQGINGKRAVAPADVRWRKWLPKAELHGSEVTTEGD